MKRTFHGSCHCKAVISSGHRPRLGDRQVQLHLLLEAADVGTTGHLAPADFRLLTVADMLGDYARSVTGVKDIIASAPAAASLPQPRPHRADGRRALRFGPSSGTDDLPIDHLLARPLLTWTGCTTAGRAPRTRRGTCTRTSRRRPTMIIVLGATSTSVSRRRHTPFGRRADHRRHPRRRAGGPGKAEGAEAAVADVGDAQSAADVVPARPARFPPQPPAFPSTDTDAEEHRTMAAIVAALEGSGRRRSF